MHSIFIFFLKNDVVGLEFDDDDKITHIVTVVSVMNVFFILESVSLKFTELCIPRGILIGSYI